mgnify:CR=1 FL=1
MINKYVSDMVENQGFNPDYYFDFLRMSNDFVQQEELKDLTTNKLVTSCGEYDLPF